MTEERASLGGDNNAGNLACGLPLLPLLWFVLLHSSFKSNNVPTELDRRNLPTGSELEVVGSEGVMGNGSSVGSVRDRLSNCKYLKL